MKKNNKGFMLVEALVSGTIVVTSILVLYTTFNKLYSKYNEKNNYYNIDALYATHEMINYLMDNNFEQHINGIFGNSTNYLLIVDGKCQTVNKSRDGNEIKVEDINTVCEGIKDLYGVNTMIISEYDKTTLKSLIKPKPEETDKIYDVNYILNGAEFEEKNLNKTFEDYIDFTVGYYGVSNHDTKYSYIVLTEIKDGDNYYYANLGIG